jgi:hypothetical protein
MKETAQMSLSLCLPYQHQKASVARRIMGDPGTTESLELPKYAYIFVLKDNGDDTWSVWRREERTLAAEDWIPTRYYGANSSREDSIYKYNKKIQFLLQNETLTGRVFAICSNMKLSFNTEFDDVSSMTQLLNWQFDSSPDSIQENLQNIYSTPYNYIRDGRYYCSFDCTAGTVQAVDLLLYHIASKVDLKWNVDEGIRIDKETPANGVRLTYLGVRRLYDGDVYCFRPMRNTLASLPASGGYDIDNIVTASDEGLWWEGRSYFYTIPYTVEGEPDYFPLQLLLRTNGTVGTGYELTLEQPIDTSDVFVPWIRGNIRITKALTDKEETIIADE